MDLVIIPVLLVGFLTAADDSKSDLDRLQGIWVLDSLWTGRGGKKLQQEMVMSGSYHLMVEGNKVIVNQEGRIVPMGTFTLVPTPTPKVYDRILPDGSFCRGIYELDRDNLENLPWFPRCGPPHKLLHGAG